MMTKKEYKRNLVRMFDNLRNEHKGESTCAGIRCRDCPFNEKVCHTGEINFRAYEAIEIVERWAKKYPIITNAEKFKEMFGTEPPKRICVNATGECENCKYFNSGWCCVKERFWNAEYKEQTKENAK